MQTRSESLSLWLGVSILVHGLAFVVWADRAFQAPSVSQPAGGAATRVSLRFAKPSAKAIPAPTPDPVARSAPVSPPELAPRQPARQAAVVPPLPRESAPTRPPRESTAKPPRTQTAEPAPVAPPVALPEEPAAPAVPEAAASAEVAASAEAAEASVPEAPDVPAEDAESLPPTTSPAIGLPAVSAGQPMESEAVDLLPSYVAEVRARIERQKRYPAMARRRGDEGVVLARVAIGSDGGLDSIDLEGEASPFLLRATREAVERARPFPMPPRGAVTIEVPVRWQVLR